MATRMIFPEVSRLTQHRRTEIHFIKTIRRVRDRVVLGAEA